MVQAIRAAAVTVCLILFACQQAPAGAQEAEGFSAADRARIEARIDQINQSLSSGDLAAAIDFMPPRLLRRIALRAGVPEAELKAATREMVATEMQGVTFVSIDTNLASAAPVRTPDGSRTYLLIPTIFVMDIPGAGRIRSTTSTLALKDGGEWYLIRIDEQNQVHLKELWPEFAPVQFPVAAMERVQ